MTYRVIITAGALARVEKYLDYLAIEKGAPLTAKRWWHRAIVEAESLATFPRRCPLAPENELRDYTIRALRVGSQLFLYRIDEPQKVVEVFAFRGGAELPRPEDLPRGK